MAPVPVVRALAAHVRYERAAEESANVQITIPLEVLFYASLTAEELNLVINAAAIGDVAPLLASFKPKVVRTDEKTPPFRTIREA